MEIFANKVKKTVDLGNGNLVVLKKLPYLEILEIGEASTDENAGRVAYKTICAHIASWSGPDLDGQPLTEETFRQLSSGFFDALTPDVLDLRGLSDEEGNESAVVSN